MKKFFEVSIPIEENGGSAELIIARMADIGFDGFLEEEELVIAYAEKGDQEEASLQARLSDISIKARKITEIDDRNWNAEWESDYEAVVIDDSIVVRAPFHEPVEDMEWDIIIEPKMSFGTAHHETTSLMLSLIKQMDLAGMSVMDMGCGTAVLAILAQKMGSVSVTAVDNDEWAYNNSIENTRLNDCNGIEVLLGDANILENRSYNIIIANINRNILLQDIPAYARALESGGKLLLSGFYTQDLVQIKKECALAGLSFVESKTKNNWMAAVFINN